MFGLGKRIKNALARIKGLPFQAIKNKALQIAIVLFTLGETTTIDTSAMTNMITSMLPLIISMISLAIPLIFIKYIMKFLEKILSGFS